MRKLSIAVALGGLVLMPLSAMSQDMALAPNTGAKSDHILFMENGSMRVPASAMDTIRSAADAAKAAPVRIEGRADYANAIKQELVRQGAPAEAISVRPITGKPLVKAGDGVTDPADRRVEIRF